MCLFYFLGLQYISCIGKSIDTFQFVCCMEVVCFLECLLRDCIKNIQCYQVTGIISFSTRVHLFGLVLPSYLCNHLNIIDAITVFVSEHHKRSKKASRVMYIQVQECYPNTQNVYGNHDMIHPAIDAQKIDAFQHQNYQINQVSHLSDLLRDTFLRMLYSLLLL